MAEGEDDVIKKVVAIKKKVDEYFVKLAAGQDAEFPNDDIDSLPEPKAFGKELEAVIAGALSEKGKGSGGGGGGDSKKGGGSEKALFDEMHKVDMAAKLYNSIRYLSNNRLLALSATRNNVDEDEDEGEGGEK